MGPNSIEQIVQKAQINFDALIAMVGGAVVSGLGFFLSRAFVRNDTNRDDIAKIHQELGLLKASKERSMEKDAELQKSFEALTSELRHLREEIHSLRERMILVEHGAGE